MTRTAPTKTATGRRTTGIRGIAAGDVTGNGLADLAVLAPNEPAQGGGVGVVRILAGVQDGPISVSPAATLARGTSSDSFGTSFVSLGFANHGLPSIAVGASGRIYIFDGPFSGSLQASSAVASINGSGSEYLGLLVAGDGDGDGHLDPVAMTYLDSGKGGGVYVFATLEQALGLSEASGGVEPDEVWSLTSVEAGDLDGDGADDFVVAWELPEDGWRPVSTVFRGPLEDIRGMADADLAIPDVYPAGSMDNDGDGRLDLLALNHESVYLLDASGTGTLELSAATAAIFGADVTAAVPAGDRTPMARPTCCWAATTRAASSPARETRCCFTGPSPGRWPTYPRTRASSASRRGTGRGRASRGLATLTATAWTTWPSPRPNGPMTVRSSAPCTFSSAESRAAPR